MAWQTSALPTQKTRKQLECLMRKKLEKYPNGKLVLLEVHTGHKKNSTLCLCFSPDVNSNGASPPEGTSLQSDILPDPDPGRPGSAWPVLAKITFDGVVVTVLNHTTQPKINEKTMLVSHPKGMPFPQEIYLSAFPDILLCLYRAIVFYQSLSEKWQ